MDAEIVRLDLSTRRRSLVGSTLGMAVYALVVVALYPAFKSSTALDTMVSRDPTAAALFGVTGRITSPAGWLNANIYANFLPLVILLLTVGYGAAAVAGQDEDGTLCLLATLPLRRRAIIDRKIAAMAVQAGILTAVVAVAVVAGRWFGLPIGVDAVVSVSATAFLMAVDLGLLTMAVGALTGRRGTALGVGTVVAAVSYVISSLAPVAAWIRPARYVSLFYWSVGRSQLERGVAVGDYAVLLIVGLCVAWAARAAFDRLDLH